MNVIEKVHFKNAKIEYNSFNIDFSKPFEEQLWELNEDLVQVRYDKGKNVYILDVGWYPGNQVSNKSGLRVLVIKNHDWQSPVFQQQCWTEEEFVRVLTRAIDLCDGDDAGG